MVAAAGMGEHKTYVAARKALNEQGHAEVFAVEELTHFHGLIVEAGKLARAFAIRCPLDLHGYLPVVTH